MTESPAPEPGTPEWHRRLAIDANNATWGLLGRDDLDTDPDGADALLAAASASMYHWRLATQPGAIERARASYLVGKAYLALGDGEAARRHADRCATLTAEAGDSAADFDRAYTHELRARVLACLGDVDAAAEERRLADAVDIADADDRALVESDLAAEPWFGLRPS